MDGFNKKILIVDDEKYLRNILKISLKKSGYECYESENGETALELLKTENQNIFLAIVDVMMPGMTGIEFLRIAKQKYPQIEFIILTAASSNEVVVDALKFGATTYCTKPLNLDEMKFIAEKTCEIYQLRAQNLELIEKLRTNLNVELENFEYKLISEELRRELFGKENLIIRLLEFIRENIDKSKLPDDIKYLLGSDE